MDGVERVTFRDLTIHDVHEHGELGSDLCGEYWNEEWLSFNGQGNPLQNAPYLYGYTGNRVHGLSIEIILKFWLKMWGNA